MIDEALFGSTAKTLLDDGHVGTSLVRGLESHAYWQPPVYIISLLPVIKIGGYSLSTLRIFSVLIGAGIILLVFGVALRVSGSLVAKVAVFILACDPHFVNTVKFARMDGLCILFVLMALAILVKPIFVAKSANSLAAGLLVALAAFTHPFGVVAVLVFTPWLLGNSSIGIRGRLKGISLFLLPVLIGLFLWGLWISQDVHSFVEQMSYQFARKDRPVVLTIVNAIKHYRNAPLALAMPLVSLGFLLPRAIRERGKLTLVVVLLGGILIVVLPKFEIPYHVYLAPLGAITAAVVLTEFWGGTSRLKRAVVTICIGGWLLNGLLVFGYLNLYFHFKLTDDADYDQFCRIVSTHLPSDATVCGWGTPCIYWGLYKHRPDVQFQDRDFLDSARANDVVRKIGYVVLSRGYTPKEDEVGLKMQRNAFSTLCSNNQRRLIAVATVGVISKYAYSAEIYLVVPLANE
jgi:4-amino-4-deoxy-L-arabinose transferase-like glycosyltransferase